VDFQHTPALAGRQARSRPTHEVTLDAPPSSPSSERRWGPWLYDERALSLVFDPRNEREAGGETAYLARDYDIDLRRCRDSHQVLDWIAQIANKTWASPATIGYLVRALNDLLGLQAFMCGGALNSATSGDAIEDMRAHIVFKRDLDERIEALFDERGRWREINVR